MGALDDRALAQFDKRNIRRAPSVKERMSLRCGAGHLVDFLRERGLVPAAAESPAPLAEFEDWLLTQHGAKASTANAYVSLLQRKVLPALADSSVPLDARRLRRAVKAAISNTSVDSAKTITGPFPHFSGLRSRRGGAQPSSSVQSRPCGGGSSQACRATLTMPTSIESWPRAIQDHPSRGAIAPSFNYWLALHFGPEMSPC